MLGRHGKGHRAPDGQCLGEQHFGLIQIAGRVEQNSQTGQRINQRLVHRSKGLWRMASTRLNIATACAQFSWARVTSPNVKTTNAVNG